MYTQVNATVEPLRDVLEFGEWKKLKSTLHSIPTCADTPQAVEIIRIATDYLIEECAFSTAFERAFVARRALHKADVATWIYAALTAVHPVSPVARRLVTLVESLATTETGRTALGRARIVDALIKVWKRAGPRGSHVPAALCALCSGHIDNISRVMRYGGIAVAETAARAVIKPTLEHNPESEGEIPALTVEERRSLECTLLLFGLLCICIPDKLSSDTQFVPLVRDVIRASLKLNERTVMAHASNMIGNITECWRKEGRGFAIIDADNVAADFVSAWKESPRDKRLVCSVAWALTGLIRTSKVTTIPQDLGELLKCSSKTNASVRALRQAVAEFKVVSKNVEKVDDSPSKDESTALESYSSPCASESTEMQESIETRGVKRARDEDRSDDQNDELNSVSKRMRIDSVLCTPQRPVDELIEHYESFTPVRPQDMQFDAEPVPLATVPKRTRRARERSLPAYYTPQRG